MSSLVTSGKRVVVAGLARSGMAAIELLLKNGAVVSASDLHPQPETLERLKALGVVFRPQDENAFTDADLIVISPGVPADLPLLSAARGEGIGVIGEVELASYFLQGKIIGVTGSNGKTTTTAMVGHILTENGIACQVGGNIGMPPTAMVHSARPDQWNVLELSSFQLQTIDHFRADIGIALNVTPDHLDVHHTFQNYAAAKGRLFETMDASGYAVLNADDPVCVGYAATTKALTVWFSSTHDVAPGFWLKGGQLFFDRQPWMEASEIPLRGVHNIENTMAAAATAHIAGASLAGIRRAVTTFPGVEHRLEFVRNVDGIDFYNDSKATNVDATQKAIDAFSGGLWVILGGKDKDSDYTTLRQSLHEKGKAALLIGAAAEKIAAQLDGAISLIQADTIEAAVDRASKYATRGDVVLLAPACASFDQFQNYEHRGRVFKELVHKLPGKGHE